ncbi:hypothetical protein [Flexithrix dorotheae]|uniref:hypothetical protein n=1 Tax=Flexithrix dorotheae TaxID=70993 RepID=UPI00036F9305|nr:hypothetical protein [Flexithrix dorotheae]
MKNIIIYISFSVLFLFSIQANAGGGWLPGKGKGYFKFGQSALRAQYYYSLDGTLTDITTTSVYISSFYGEYGFSERIAAIAYVPFFFRTTINELRFRQSGNVIPGDELNSVGDMEFTLKYGIIQNKPFVLSGSLTLGIPTGKTMGGETQTLQTGDGEFNQLLKLEGSYSIPGTSAYLTATVGFNNRTKGFSDEFHIGIEGGYSFGKKFTGIVKVYNLSSFKNGTLPPTSNSLFSNNMEYLSITPELVYQANDKYGINAKASFAPAGKNVLAAPFYELGLYLKI